MKKKLNKALMSFILTAALFQAYGIPALADEAPAAVAESAAPKVYSLTEKLQVQIKSVANERVPDGTRIGAVVKMKNTGDGISRVPDFELKAKTAEGVSYTLQPSAANAKSVQPLAETELSYLSVIDRTDAIELSELYWMDVDYYVYPKKETLVVSAPIEYQPWKGGDTTIADPKALRKWTDSFKIPALSSPVQFTPTGIHKESAEQGTVYVVQLLAVNPASQRETVPDFSMDGKAEGKTFSGKRVEQGPIVLEGGEQKYIHYAIPTEQDTALASLNLLTTETFAQAGASGAGAAAAVQYQVGRLNIMLPGVQESANALPYAMGEPMRFDARSELIHPDIQVSLAGLSLYGNDEEGNAQATAKFVLANKSDRPMNVPVFQTGLVSSDGYEYNGRRQTMSADPILPNSEVVVNYGFILPASEKGGEMTLKVQDAIVAAPYKSTIGAYRVSVDNAPLGDKFSMYPFEIGVDRWDISYLFNTATLTYSYKGKFFFHIERKSGVQVDAGFSKLQFEIYDGTGRLLGTGRKALIGEGRLVSGENNLTLAGTSEQFDSPLKLKMFEVFATASGESKRLVAEYER